MLTNAKLDSIYGMLHGSMRLFPGPDSELPCIRERNPTYCLILSLGAKFNLLGGTRYFRKRRLRYLRRGGKP